MEKKTTVYVELGDGCQVKVELTHETEPLPTPLEKKARRELTCSEMETVKRKIGKGLFTYQSNF